MRLIVDRLYRVDASCSLEVELPASAVWGQIRDVARFLSIDPLHARVRPARRDEVPRRGAGREHRQDLIIEHRLLGVGPDRVGRVLAWREGVGYAVSDLSRRGFDRGFPHVCTYRIDAVSPRRSRLTIGARGRWTATWLPRWMVKAWLAWVLGATARHVSVELAALAAWLAHRPAGP